MEPERARFRRAEKEVLNLMADVIRKPDGRGEPDGLMAKKGDRPGRRERNRNRLNGTRSRAICRRRRKTRRA